MRKIVAVESVSLDGVMQAPGGPDEDTREGFMLGGWAASYHDDVMMQEMSRGFGQDLLFGRRTYEQFYSFWPKQDGNPFTDVLNNATNLLLIHPVLLNSGRRLFADTGSFAELELVNSVTTTTGVIIATYRPREKQH